MRMHLLINVCVCMLLSMSSCCLTIGIWCHCIFIENLAILLLYSDVERLFDEGEAVSVSEHVCSLTSVSAV